jgi:hypothetical protein
MAYRINVAKKYKTEIRGGKEHNLYRHYFKIKTEMLYAYTKELVREMQQNYPAPEYNVTLYRETSHSEQVELAEKEAV